MLEAIWTKIGECIDEKKSLVLYFDGCTALKNPTAVNRLIGHMDVCADCCEEFGSSIKLTAIPTVDKEPPLMYLKNYNWDRKEEDEDSWDDDDDFAADLLAKYADVLKKDRQENAEDIALQKLNDVPKDDQSIINVIRDWVNVIISDMGVCPFSKNADNAGLPVGPGEPCMDRKQTKKARDVLCIALLRAVCAQLISCCSPLPDFAQITPGGCVCGLLARGGLSCLQPRKDHFHYAFDFAGIPHGKR